MIHVMVLSIRAVLEERGTEECIEWSGGTHIVGRLLDVLHVPHEHRLDDPTLRDKGAGVFIVQKPNQLGRSRCRTVDERTGGRVNAHVST